jgi:hypothetical protein
MSFHQYITWLSENGLGKTHQSGTKDKVIHKIHSLFIINNQAPF